MRRLTSSELIDLGLSVSERRRLLMAASALDQLASQEAARSPANTPSSERRHLTVLFCDMVSSTHLSRNLDPEDYSEVIQAYAERTRVEIERFGGHVLRLMGDGVLALFGYPKAHEDDAERAVLAAIACIKANSSVPIRTGSGDIVDIQVRLGLHTGLAIVGAHDPALGSDVAGAAPNLAARLQSEAAPGEILISAHTQRLAGNRFEYEALEPRMLKGISEPTTPYRVRREIPTKTRFEVRNRGELAPLVGREQNLSELLSAWSGAHSGHGNSVLVTGPAGIGKSRLTGAFRDAVRQEANTRLTFQCSPHHSGTPLYPVVIRLSQEIDSIIAGGAKDRQEAMIGWLERTGEADSKSLALLSSLLSPDESSLAQALDMSPRQRMDESLLLLANRGIALSRRRPLVLLFEDIHWADATTLRLIKQCCEACRNDPVLLLATIRSDFEQKEPPDHFDTIIDLNRLHDEDALDIARKVAQPHQLPEDTLQAIVDRGEGVPLFVEELTKSVIERLAGQDVNINHSQDRGLIVPESLVDSLSARLDALPSAKHLAQIASAIGREVPLDLLQSVSNYASRDFDAAVSELLEAGLFLSVPATESQPLVFSHALVQEVAYQLLLRRDRRKIHANIVRVLEQEQPETCRKLPEEVARHCEEAQQIDKALDYLIRAGTRAIGQSANVEALKHLKHARQLIRNQNDMPQWQVQDFELEIEGTIGAPLILVEGYTSKETVQAFERAEQISVELGDNQSQFQALFGLWGHRWMAGHIELSQRLADEMLTIAANDLTPERKILAHRCAGSSCWIIGDLHNMHHHFDIVKSLTGDSDTKQLADRYAVCPRVVAQVLGGYLTWLEGDREAGYRLVADGLDRSNQMKHAYSQALSHSIIGGLKLLEGDYDGLDLHAARLREIAEHRRFPYWLTYAETLEGALLAHQGKLEEGREKILQSIEKYDVLGVKIHRTMQLVLLSDIELKRGNLSAALRWLDEAQTVGKSTGERQWFKLIEQRRSRISLLSQDVPEAGEKTSKKNQHSAN